MVCLKWDFNKDDEKAKRYIVRLGTLLARLRGTVVAYKSNDGAYDDDYSYLLPTIEEPDRANFQLYNLARGHALSQGCNYITLNDIELVIKVVLSTASIERVTIFELLLNHGGEMTTTQITTALNVSKPTARRTMTELKALGLVNMTYASGGNTLEYKITLDGELFGWFLGNEFSQLRKGFVPSNYREYLREKLDVEEGEEVEIEVERKANDKQHDTDSSQNEKSDSSPSIREEDDNDDGCDSDLDADHKALKAKLYTICKNLIESNGAVLKSDHIWPTFNEESKATIVDGHPQSCDTKEYGRVSQRLIRRIITSKFFATEKHNEDGNSFVFDIDKLRQIDSCYNNSTPSTSTTPSTPAVATPNVVKVMRQHAYPEILEKVWKASFPGQIPDRLVIAEELKGNIIDLEGHDLIAVELGHTDTDHTTCLIVPSIGLVVAGDAAYNDVHLYLAESNAKSRREWISALDKIESLNPRAVIAAHKRPGNDDNPRIIEETRQYIRDFDRIAEITTTVQDLYDRMLELYPNRVNPGWALWSSARAVKQ
jgi:DNA-binding transcriptional ArsR family regulator